MNKFIAFQLENINRIFEAWMKKREREVVYPAELEFFDDIPYRDTGKNCHRLDICRRKGSTCKLPVIVNFHGGGLLLCTRKVNRPFCAELAKRGFLVFNVDYPLVPEADVYEILADGAAGMDAVAKLIESYGGDPNRVFIVGDSAGAFIGVYELAAQKNPEVAQALRLRPTALFVRAAAYLSGMFYTTRLDSVGAFLKKDYYGAKWKNNPFREFADPAVPAVAGVQPPTYLVTAKLDNLRGYPLDYCRGLKKAGIFHVLRDLPARVELNHDFAIIAPENETAQKVIDEICEFLNSH